ncbi:MAG: 2,3-bisphosphoglycerate-independent phosphoglycerate mutase [Candidatus Thermoplasmatota archaeon]
MDLNIIKKLKKPSDTKIVLMVIDGLGGLPGENGLTELEAAHTPNLDKLATKSICGLQQPVAPGITPGSGPGHLSLFGYNPIKYQVGRGVLSAAGIDFKLKKGDISARGNFCEVNKNEEVVDRRAGRIPSEKNQQLCEILRDIEIPGVEIHVETVKEYRFLLVIRGENLSADISDTDPQEIGKKPLDPKPLSEEAKKTAEIVNSFINQAQKKLKDQHPANMVLLRGFSKKPDWPTMNETYGLKAAAIASYPMYRGISRLLGMNVLETGEEIAEEFETLEKNWDNFDFFYVHIKKTDSYGEDGDYNKKLKEIERVDNQISRVIDLNPDVLIVTGDHSTPSQLEYHSWHPVPVLLYSGRCRVDEVKIFGERSCTKGGLGCRFPGEDLMPLAMANAERLEKFGA